MSKIRKLSKIQNSFAIILVFLLIFSLGCFDNDTKSKQVNSNKAPKTQTDKNQSGYDPRASVALKEYLYVKYGGNGNSNFGVSWYQSVVNITVSNGDNKNVRITTSLKNNDQGKSDALSLANAILANGLVDVGSVSVTDQSGAVLASRDVSN